MLKKINNILQIISNDISNSKYNNEEILNLINEIKDLLKNNNHNYEEIIFKFNYLVDSYIGYIENQKNIDFLKTNKKIYANQIFSYMNKKDKNFANDIINLNYSLLKKILKNGKIKNLKILFEGNINRIPVFANPLIEIIYHYNEQEKKENINLILEKHLNLYSDLINSNFEPDQSNFTKEYGKVFIKILEGKNINGTFDNVAKEFLKKILKFTLENNLLNLNVNSNDELMRNYKELVNTKLEDMIKRYPVLLLLDIKEKFNDNLIKEILINEGLITEKQVKKTKEIIKNNEKYSMTL